MIQLPEGFNLGALLADFSLLAGGVLGLVAGLVTAFLIGKAIRRLG